MRIRTLIAATAVAAVFAAPAVAATIKPVVNIVTDKANDLRGVAFTSNGKIVVSGHAGTETDTRTVVARFNADGTPDATFGRAGFAEVDLMPGRNEQSLGVAPMANGDVVVAVNAVDADGGTSVYLLRFDSAGVRKMGPAWGDADGKVEVTFGWSNKDNALFTGANRPADTAWDLQVDRSGGGERLVVFGLGSAAQGSGRTDTDRYVVRLNGANGNPDATFNGGKPFLFHSAGVLGDNARRGLVEADGAILASGYTGIANGGNHVFLFRLTPAGALDTNFGNFVTPATAAGPAGVTARPGVAVFNPFLADGGFAETYGVARLKDGSYVTTGYGQATAVNGTSTMGYVASVQPDVVSFRVKGTTLDTTWGNKGTVAIQSEGKGKATNEDRGRAVVALADDRTVHVGRFGGVAAAFVLTPAGQLDTTEGAGGIIELPNADIDAQLFAVATSADGKRIATTTNAHAKGARLVVLEVQ